mgnify:CR=1 FL=1
MALPDEAVLPRSRRTWSSWNVSLAEGFDEQVAVTYLMNHLQSLPVQTPLCVTLNHTAAIDPASPCGLGLPELAPGPMSLEPSLVLVWLSKTGSMTLMDMAAMTDLRTSEAS